MLREPDDHAKFARPPSPMLDAIRQRVAEADDDELCKLLHEQAVSLSMGALLTQLGTAGARRVLADLRELEPEWFDQADDEDDIPEAEPPRFVPAAEGDVFLPIHYQPGSLAAEIAATTPRFYERGCVARAEAMIPAFRHPDGSVMVLETEPAEKAPP